MRSPLGLIRRSILLCIILLVNFGGYYFCAGQCGPAVRFYASEKRLREEEQIEAKEYCSNFENKEECKTDDDYNVCKWCEQHKSESKATDTSARCVAASYQWTECTRQLAPPRRERMKHTFDWSKSIPTTSKGNEEDDDGNVVHDRLGGGRNAGKEEL